jgi:hypothetical protein
MTKPTIEELGYVDEMRQRLGLEAGDTSCDEEIVAMSPMERVGLIAGWFLGDNGWADTFKDYFESQGLYLTTNADDPNVILGDVE